MEIMAVLTTAILVTVMPMPAKLAFDFDPFELAGVEKPKKPADAAKAAAEIAVVIAKRVIEDCGDGRSPIAGGSWKRSLSPEYKKKKTAQGGNNYADMLLDGDMLLALDVKQKGAKLELGVYGSKEAAKADGHNNHSGKSPLPLREFIPKPGQTFRRAIIEEIREIAQRYQSDDDGQ
jgi:hypothetical protein